MLSILSGFPGHTSGDERTGFPLVYEQNFEDPSLLKSLPSLVSCESVSPPHQICVLANQYWQSHSRQESHLIDLGIQEVLGPAHRRSNCPDPRSPATCHFGPCGQSFEHADRRCRWTSSSFPSESGSLSRGTVGTMAGVLTLSSSMAETPCSVTR